MCLTALVLTAVASVASTGSFDVGGGLGCRCSDHERGEDREDDDELVVQLHDAGAYVRADDSVRVRDFGGRWVLADLASPLYTSCVRSVCCIFVHCCLTVPHCQFGRGLS